MISLAPLLSISLAQFITFKLDADLKNFKKVLGKIIDEKKKFLDAKRKLTWENYSKEHLKIWQSLRDNKT